MRQRLPDPEYLKLLMPYGEMIQKLALATRKLILEEAPTANEFVYEVYTIADHFALTERSERTTSVLIVRQLAKAERIKR
jgi:hypothetical protein